MAMELAVDVYRITDHGEFKRDFDELNLSTDQHLNFSSAEEINFSLMLFKYNPIIIKIEF
ncbi:MAG: hypothetical protein U5R06_04030 [candidate division KSB1 bacterium]|nr:hypothetical protein [candidate division KSB1 bacterium]